MINGPFFTIVRYQIEKVPCLTIFEIYRYSTQNSMPTDRQAKLKTQSQTNLSDVYNSLSDNQNINSHNGFYRLANNNYKLQTINYKLYDNRISASKISAEKIKRAKRVARFLKLIPFVKSIAITGSVSMNSTSPESDIDLFIISQENRIWLTRILTVFITHLSGQRRYKNKIQNRICLNLYIANKNTVFPIQNIASAHMIARALPIYGKDIFISFLSANKNWLGEYIGNFDKNFLIQRGFANYKLQTINYKLIDFLEKIIGKILSARIIRNTPNAKPPHLIINNNALIFYYPHSKNQEILERYEKAIALHENKI